MKYFNIIFLVFFIFLFNINITKEEYDFVLNTKYVSSIPIIEEKILNSYIGDITGYGPNCNGCIGITASGYDVRNTIYYEDSTYKKVRIVAADKTIPFGTIVKLNLPNHDIIAIVLDRGSAIGFNKGAIIDLLFKSEEETLIFGRNRNVKVDVLRIALDKK